MFLNKSTFTLKMIPHIIEAHLAHIDHARMGANDAYEKIGFFDFNEWYSSEKPLTQEAIDKIVGNIIQNFPTKLTAFGFKDMLHRTLEPEGIIYLGNPTYHTLTGDGGTLQLAGPDTPSDSYLEIGLSIPYSTPFPSWMGGVATDGEEGRNIRLSAQEHSIVKTSERHEYVAQFLGQNDAEPNEAEFQAFQEWQANRNGGHYDATASYKPITPEDPQLEPDQNINN